MRGAHANSDERTAFAFPRFRILSGVEQGRFSHFVPAVNDRITKLLHSSSQVQQVLRSID